MESIYNSIKNDIRNHPEVKSSVLGQVRDWKRSQFVILSEIISACLAQSELLNGDRKFEIGTSISHITLQRFFENNYCDKTHNDLRFLKTLDKLCIFLEENDLNTYIKHKKSEKSSLNNATIDADFCRDLIIDFCNAQFTAAKKLPISDISSVLEFVFENSPLCERIRNFVEEQSQKKLKLITENNRSNFEIFDFSVVTNREDLKVIKTQEFWNLLFKDIESGEKHIINRLNAQSYFIKKIEGKWKIWDNYNPNSGQIIKA